MSPAGGRGAVIVVAPGLGTTVQDVGRIGWQRLGVPVSGALDRMALAAANIVVGNPPRAAGLECLYQGPELEIQSASARLAVAGAGASIELLQGGAVASQRVPALESVTLAAGQRLRVRLAGPSISACLAIAGGIAVPEIMGSRSTYARAAIGGHHGRALRAGDTLPLGKPATAERGDMRLPGVELAPAGMVRIVLGPQDDHFTAAALAVLASATFTVQPASDRMGLRLDGPRLEHKISADIVSDGIPPGAIQVPGDGLPIIMLADRQTTGGYTKIAAVISADLPALGRVGPGAALRFRIIEVAEAESIARAQAAHIAEWQQLLVAANAAVTPEALYDANLISGVIDGNDWCALPIRFTP